MKAKNFRYFPRKPRHPAAGNNQLRVVVARSRGSVPKRLQAELTNFSRHGFQLRVAFPLKVEEPINVRFHEEATGLRLALPALVRWRGPERDGKWLVGCLSAREVDLETLGELFLSNVLASEGPSSKAAATTSA